jgi:hypothetical protein
LQTQACEQVMVEFTPIQDSKTTLRKDLFHVACDLPDREYIVDTNIDAGDDIALIEELLKGSIICEYQPGVELVKTASVDANDFENTR